MTSADLFTFRDQQVRAAVIDGEPWFVAADVARAVGLSNTAMAVGRLDDDEKGVSLIDTPGGRQSLTTINEPGLYSLIVRSDKPEAKAFKRWVTHEVLPAIRRHGVYATPATVDAMLSDPDAMIAALTSLKEERARRAEVEARAKQLEGPAAQAEMNRQADGLRNIGDLANDLRMHCATNFPGVQVRNEDVFDLAGRVGLIIRGNTVRNNQPKAEAVKAGWVKSKTTTFDTKHGPRSSTSTRLTPRGYGRLWDKAIANITEQGRVLPPAKEAAA